ncbi:MAG TPA: hypothetical protein VMN58_00375 [Acidimicrobiales bacterium]|nr:hypothetical protein [Acidimicrobiales bacterium]
MSESVPAIEEIDYRLAELLRALDVLRRRFLEEAAAHGRRRFPELVETELAGYPLRVEALGRAALDDLRRRLDEQLDDMEACVEAHLGADDHWAHLLRGTRAWGAIDSGEYLRGRRGTWLRAATGRFLGEAGRLLADVGVVRPGDDLRWSLHRDGKEWAVSYYGDGATPSDEMIALFTAYSATFDELVTLDRRRVDGVQRAREAS